MLTLEQLTPEQKIGRVLCFRRFTEEEDIEFTLEMVKKEAVGAIQLKFNNRTKALAKKIREAADYPVIIVNDMEQGFPLSSLPKIPMMTLAAANDPEYSRLFGAAIAKEAREYGYSGCWGPIVDILLVDGPCSVYRKAADTPDAVTEVARDILRAFDSYSFHGTAKHYPGGQDNPVDTHMADGIASADKKTLLERDLTPYLTLMKEELLPAIMVGHQVCPKIDDIPATLSKKVIDIIREEGYDGVLYTDSLAMMAILQKYGERGAMEMAFNAGCDIILPNYRTTAKDAYEMMLSAYREGLISDERLDEAVRRVMKLEQYCARTPKCPVPVPDNIAEILDNIARDSITAECVDGIEPAVDPKKPGMFVVSTPLDFKEEDSGAEIYTGSWYDPRRVADSISESFPNARIEFVSEYEGAARHEQILNAATGYDEVVFVSFCTSTSYLGTDCLTRRTEALINAFRIAGKLEALVHFGNPLALGMIGDVSRILLGYTAPSAQKYAFEVLAGKLPARGKNPFPRLMKESREKR